MQINLFIKIMYSMAYYSLANAHRQGCSLIFCQLQDRLKNQRNIFDHDQIRIKRYVNNLGTRLFWHCSKLLKILSMFGLFSEKLAYYNNNNNNNISK